MDELEQKTLSLKSQGAWIMSAKIVGFALSFLLPLLTVRFLDQEKVGLYRQSFQIIANVVSILPLGISLSAYYFLARESENRASAVFNILLFNFAAGALAFLGLYFYPQILGKIFQSKEMTLLAPIIGLVIWLWIFSMFLEVIALANRDTRVATVFIILAQFSKTALMSGAVIIFGTVEAFLYAAIIQGVLQTIILMIYLNSRFPRFWKTFNLPFFREHIFYALPFGFSSLLWTIQTEMHNYFVGYRFSETEYAIYAYGCFQLPLIGILYESTNAVLTSRMSELQSQGEKREMLFLTIRAMEKLSLFYLPVYVFLLITAEVFVITLFTRNYLASVPIMMINLTLLPFDLLVIDPMVRAYKDLGRVLIMSRFFITLGLFISLYFGIQYFGLIGIVSIVVVTNIFEKIFVGLILGRKLGIKWEDWRLLKNVGKTALISIFAGILTLLTFWQIKDIAFNFGAFIIQMVFVNPSQNVTDFISGSCTLGITFLIFVPIYIFGINFLNLINKEEKEFANKMLERLQGFFRRE